MNYKITKIWNRRQYAATSFLITKFRNVGKWRRIPQSLLVHNLEISGNGDNFAL